MLRALDFLGHSLCKAKKIVTIGTYWVSKDAGFNVELKNIYFFLKLQQKKLFKKKDA
jgi:hypothetical protein